MLKSLYRTLPEPLREPFRLTYSHIYGSRQITDGFVSTFFENQTEFDQYYEEFQNSGIREQIADAAEEYRSLTGRDTLSGHAGEALAAYYTLIRKVQPAIIVETGVAHGTSTLTILTALEKNGHGELHSIDLPYTAPNVEESSDERYRSWHRNQLQSDVDTVTDDTGILIPAEHEPGWIVPEDLRSRWTFHEGRSQRKLPEVVTSVGELDLFIHDSNHTLPCQLYEYELAWAWLRPGGILLSDDIRSSEAFNVFRQERVTAADGLVRRGIGYAQKPSDTIEQ